MQTYAYSYGVVWKGSVREVTAEIKRLVKIYPRLTDLIKVKLH
jgi:hypothetical protein